MYFLAEALPIVRRVRIPFNRDQVMLLLAAVNEIFIGADIYLAHDLDGTIKPYEWIPIIFGPVAGILLLVAGLVALRRRMLANLLGTGIFIASIVVGVLGSYFHLNRALLPYAPAGQQITAQLVVWGPPLLGPLTFILVAIIGISAAWQEDPVDSGRLILPGGRRMQMPYSKTRAYFFMVSLFILVTVISSVLDHARTNFANPWLWLPTFSGIFATVVAAAMGLYNRLERGDILTYIFAMVQLALVGLVGAWLHIDHNLTAQGTIIGERFLRGAPLMAPLLFANMGLLSLIVLLDPHPPARKEAE